MDERARHLRRSGPTHRSEPEQPSRPAPARALILLSAVLMAVLVAAVLVLPTTRQATANAPASPGGSTVTSSAAPTATTPTATPSTTPTATPSTTPTATPSAGPVVAAGTDATAGGQAAFDDRSTAVAEPVTVMPVGDSVCRLTVGLVAAQLKSDHAPVAFVGTARSGEPVDHQCRSSWSAASMAGLVPPPSWTDQAAMNTVEATRRLRPQLSYVMAGVNDLPQGSSPNQAAANLRTLLVRLTTVNPDGRYLVSSVLGFTSGVRAYNALLPGVVATLRAGGADVTFVDLAAGLSRADLSDGVHPNTAGQRKLAHEWATVVLSTVGPTPVGQRVAGR